MIDLNSSFEASAASMASTFINLAQVVNLNVVIHRLGHITVNI